MCGRAAHSVRGVASALTTLDPTYCSSHTNESSGPPSAGALDGSILHDGGCSLSGGGSSAPSSGVARAQRGAVSEEDATIPSRRRSLTTDEHANKTNDDGEDDAAATIRWLEQSFSASSIDNPNVSPGQETIVLRRRSSHNSSSSNKNRTTNGTIECAQLTWGLVPKEGTPTSPLPTPSDKAATSLHYAMFNARSESVYDRPSFRPSMLAGRTCLLPVDGYYEWKDPPMNTAATSGRKKKQPYCLARRRGEEEEGVRRPLWLAGLWTSVRTGRKINHGSKEEEEVLNTFALLTTDATPGMQWLHHRQPVMLWDKHAALDYLLRPSREVFQNILVENQKDAYCTEHMAIYPVSNQMNDPKYRGGDCTKEVKIVTLPSVKSFFGASTSVGNKHNGDGDGKTDAVVAAGERQSESPRARNKKRPPSQIISLSSKTTKTSKVRMVQTAPSREHEHEKSAQFCTITGLKDPSQAARYLKMSGGNLEAAIGIFLDQPDGMAGAGTKTRPLLSLPTAKTSEVEVVEIPSTCRTPRPNEASPAPRKNKKKKRGAITSYFKSTGK